MIYSIRAFSTARQYTRVSAMDTLDTNTHDIRYNDYEAFTSARREDTSACDLTRLAKYETSRVSWQAKVISAKAQQPALKNTPGGES